MATPSNPSGAVRILLTFIATLLLCGLSIFLLRLAAVAVTLVLFQRPNGLMGLEFFAGPLGLLWVVTKVFKIERVRSR